MKKLLTTKPRWVLLILAFCCFGLQSYADSEPNNTIATAENASFGAAVSGSLNQAPVGDADDVYLIVAPSDGDITLSADIGAGLNVYIHIYDKTGAGNVQAYAPAGNTVSITKYCMAADSFIVHIDHNSGAGSYSFSTSIHGSDFANDAEDNGSIANATQFIYDGESVTGHIGSYDTDTGYDDFDYFGVVLPEDGSYTFRAIKDPGHGNENFYLDAVRKDGNEVASTYSYNDTTYTLVNCLAADTVYLRVHRNSGCGGYTLSFENTTPPVSANDTEDNGSLANATQFIADGETVTGHIGYYDTDTGYDNFDYFGVILPEDGSYTFRAIKDPGHGDENYYLDAVRKDGNEAGSTYSYSDTTYTTVNCLAADTVYLRVHSNTGCGGYTLSFENTTPPVSANDAEDNSSIANATQFISDGETVSGHIGYYDTDIGYDNFDYFGVILPEDGSYTFRAIKDPGHGDENYYLDVVRKDSTEAVSAYSYNDTTYATANCLAADTVYLRVHRNTGCGGYTLSFDAPELTYNNDTGDNETLESAALVQTSSVNEGHLGEYDVDTGIDTWDYYKFTVVQVPFDLDIKVELAEGLNTYLDLLNSAGSQIQSEYHTPGSYHYTRTLTVAGDYYIRLHYNTGCGSYSIGNFCANAPEVAITADGPTDICPGGSVTLTATAGLNAYSWIKDDAEVATTQSYVATEPGTYFVTGYDVNGCDGISEEVVIGVFGVPDVSVSTDEPTTFCTGGSITLTATAGFDSYEWSNGDSGQSIEVSESGTYTVTATNADGCDAVSSNSIDVTVQIDSDGDGVCDVDDSCPNLFGQIGDACDDGNPNTENDEITSDCECVGTPASLENNASLCSDGIDNDGDGLIDCEDPGCQSLANNGCSTCFGDGTTFADEVIDYNNGCPINQSTDPTKALGVADYSGTAGSYVSLGEGGFVKLKFTNNTLTNSGNGNPDLFVFEVGPLVEPSTIELRPANVATANFLISEGILDIDEDGFYEFGQIGGATASVDIDSFFDEIPANSLFFDAIKIVDVADLNCSGADPGADIDAVCALSSVECAVGETCDDGNPNTENDVINANCDCVGTLVCSSPVLMLEAQDFNGNQIEDCLEAGSNYYVLATLSGGSGNGSYDVSANGGTAVNVAADGSNLFGPFDAGTSVNISASGADDAQCGAEESIASPAVCAPACESPSLDLTAVDADGSAILDCIPADGVFYVNAALNGGSGNVSYTISANDGGGLFIYPDASQTFGPFDQGTDVTISVVGNVDDACGAEETIASPGICGTPCESPSLSLSTSDATGLDIEGCLPVDGVYYVDFHLTGGSGNDTYSVAVNGDFFETVNAGSQWYYHFGPFDAGEDLDFLIIGADDAQCGAEGSIASPEVCAPACESPSLDLTAVAADGSAIADCIPADGVFYVNATLSGGSGNASYDLSANDGTAVNVATDGSMTFGPFDAGTSVNVSADGADDAQCGVEESIASPDVCSPTGCNNFVYFLADHSASDDISDIYKVTLSGGDANLEKIITSQIEVHIAYNPDDNLIYAVSKNFSSYRTLDPYATVPSFGPTHELGTSVPEITAAVFSPFGKLLIGSQTQNKIYSVNVSTDAVSLYDSYAPVTGGDLAYRSDGMLYLATRTGAGLYQVWPEGVMPDQLLPGPGVPDHVTGMAITDGDQLLVSSRDNTDLVLRNTDGSDGGSYAVLLNGESFTLRDGDMASGCDTHQNVNDDCDYKLYFIHSPSGGGNEPLLEVTLNNDGTASTNTLIANIGGHIGLSPDGATIYNVGGSNLKVIDVATASVSSTVNIHTAGGQNLSGFPAAVVSSAGTLYVGNSSHNQVYEVDPASGVAIPYGPSHSVQGGDLIEVNGELWLITRGNNTFTNVLTGDSFTVSVNEINGAAVLSNGNVLVADGNGGSLLKEIDLSTKEVVKTYDIGLPLHNGDFAGRCMPNNPIIVPGECYAAEVVDYTQGVQENGSAVSVERTDASNALGMPQRSDELNYVSLGYGGSLTLAFNGAVPNGAGDDIEIVETTFNFSTVEAYPEYADVFVSVDGVSWFLASAVNHADHENRFIDISDAGAFDNIYFVKIVNSDDSSTPDGFDVDGVVALHNCESDGDEVPALIASSKITSFPNPTSGSSEVVFSTGATSRTIVDVYDMNGRNVATIFNQVAKANHEYRLDFNGSSLPNGVYIYRMTTNDETIIDKFMIAR